MHRRTGLNALRSFDRFRDVSVRILSDLVEQALANVGVAERRSVEAHFDEAKAALLVALDEPIQVAATPSGPPVVLPAGAMHALDFSATDDKEVRVRSASGAPANCLLLPSDFLARAVTASFPLACAVGKRPAFERIWVCERPRLGAPLEALTQLLAVAVAREFDEGTAILLLREAGSTLLAWEGDRFVDLHLELRLAPSAEAVTVDDIASVCTECAGRPVDHLFIVSPEGARDFPRPFAEWTVHRVAYVTDTVPDRMPAEIEHRLIESVRNRLEPSSPYYGAFVASVVSPGTTARLPFSEPIAEDIVDRHAGGEHRPGWRIRRDACRLAFDIPALDRHWDDWTREKDRTLAFPLRLAAEYGQAASRWARALTNRRVGFAVSGGGACSYRVVPLLRLLHERCVPVDIVSGVSGGALLGAYYCAEGLAGLDRLISRGWLYQAVVMGAILDSRVVERVVDADLGRRRVDDLAVRFVPVTTALRGTAPPQAHAVVGGTLGQAVRVSGSAPLGFAPSTYGGVRFADGATSAPVPARALCDYGADFVLAANSVPAPACSNPLDESTLGRFLYRQTLVGRLVDLWVSGAFLLDRISDAIEDDAHVYFEPPEDMRPLLEAFRFYDAAGITRESAASTGVHEKARECAERWHEFSWRRQGQK
jgi:predicted patatin/cPLA2 family phospholipase